MSEENEKADRVATMSSEERAWQVFLVLVAGGNGGVSLADIDCRLPDEWQRAQTNRKNAKKAAQHRADIAWDAVAEFDASTAVNRPAYEREMERREKRKQESIEYRRRLEEEKKEQKRREDAHPLRKKATELHAQLAKEAKDGDVQAVIRLSQERMELERKIRDEIAKGKLDSRPAAPSTSDDEP